MSKKISKNQIYVTHINHAPPFGTNGALIILIPAFVMTFMVKDV